MTYNSIRLKNEILTPEVLRLYRSGDLTLSAIQGSVGPLSEIYKNTYHYLDDPAYLRHRGVIPNGLLASPVIPELAGPTIPLKKYVPFNYPTVHLTDGASGVSGVRNTYNPNSSTPSILLPPTTGVKRNLGENNQVTIPQPYVEGHYIDPKLRTYGPMVSPYLKFPYYNPYIQGKPTSIVYP